VLEENIYKSQPTKKISGHQAGKIRTRWL